MCGVWVEGDEIVQVIRLHPATHNLEEVVVERDPSEQTLRVVLWPHTLLVHRGGVDVAGGGQ